MNDNTIPPRAPEQLQVYSTLPEATEEVFRNAIPLVGADGEQASKLVLYAPNLVSVGSLDNTNAEGSTTFSKSITSGFSATTGISLTNTLSMEFSVEFFKAKLETSIGMSFSNTWNTSTTQTATFSAPKDALVFLYQGVIMTRKIIFFPATFEYKWADTAGSLDTNVIKTTSTPILGPVSNVRNLLIT
ncbi:MAG: hypothetical protein ACJAVV_003910 [Alphaproteobacteria bacterium]|jgi:hypothetical protein